MPLSGLLRRSTRQAHISSVAYSGNGSLFFGLHKIHPTPQVFFVAGAKLLVKSALTFLIIFSPQIALAGNLSPEYCNRLADAIYKAEGGAKTSHPYGILKKYKKTSPRQACINTIRSKFREWEALGAKGDFLDYLASRYCPIGASNDPTGLNKNWLPNVRKFLQ